MWQIVFPQCRLFWSGMYFYHHQRVFLKHCPSVRSPSEDGMKPRLLSSISIAGTQMSLRSPSEQAGPRLPLLMGVLNENRMAFSGLPWGGTESQDSDSDFVLYLSPKQCRGIPGGVVQAFQLGSAPSTGMCKVWSQRNDTKSAGAHPSRVLMKRKNQKNKKVVDMVILSPNILT